LLGLDPAVSEVRHDDDTDAQTVRIQPLNWCPRALIGVGTGSTVNLFIEALAADPGRVHSAVSSSEASSVRLQAAGIRVLDLNEVTELHLYIDGADEATPARQLIKGGGGALTREKIVAAAARRFICIVDETKIVKTLGKFPLPIEVIPWPAPTSHGSCARGGRPVARRAQHR
jgi:ribose 5-phosphate isomerase A